MKRIVLYLIIITFMGISTPLISQVTTAFLTGEVKDQEGNALIGANIKAIHEPSGTIYGAISQKDGIYRISNMRIGGPYTITVSYVGHNKVILENLNLRVGETVSKDFALSSESLETETILVTAQSGSVGKNSGTATQISNTQIENMPTLDRNLNDFLRFTPQSSSYGGGITIGGVNNRYNAIYVDGAVNNDVFGLASSGTNGGQVGISPFSLDIIDQIQVVLSPYDVTLSGFAGGGINAVTRSGTNQFKATAYQFFKNQGLVGKDNSDYADFTGIERQSFDDFVERQIGASLSGPIIEDKLFFFTNVEIQADESPLVYDPEVYINDRDGRYSLEEINQLREHVITKYNYNPGTIGNTTRNLDGTKFFGKLNWNISDNHKLVLRHQYTNAESFSRSIGNSSTINFSNNGIFFPTTTNTSALELNSSFGENYSNNLIIGFTSVRDNRGPLEKAFPYVRIDDAAGGSLQLGSEQFSTANQLDQDIFTITNNFRMYMGNHTLTLGTHNEFYSIYNLFLRQNFGFYRYSNLQDFLNDEAPSIYQRTYANTGDGAADFSAMQFGIYAQDEWIVNDNLSLTLGLRFDLPIITTNPATPDNFNSTTLDEIRNFYPIASNVESGKAPDGQLMISPRIGFTYTPEEIKTRIRGGVGVFTSRIPFVWPGAMFTNNGISSGGVDLRGDAVSVLQRGDGGYFNPDPTNQYRVPPGSPSGQIDLFTNDFKYPQVLRTNLAFDFELPYGIETTIEGFYTKTLNNIVYTNINSDPTLSHNLTGSPDNRPVYVNKSIDPNYAAVYLASNTNEGYTYNVAINLSKSFDFGLDAQLAYSWSDAYALSEGTSSQNSSQWRGQVSIDGRNNPSFGRSDFAVGHRAVAALSYTQNWTDSKLFGTTISLFVNAQSGNPFSYVIGGGRSAQNINGETGSNTRNRSLVYIPNNASEINLIDYTQGDQIITKDEQWARLDKFINEDSYLSNNRGQYAEKNGAWAPFATTFDLSIRQNLGIEIQGSKNRLQLSFDIFNFGNMLNSAWGTVYNVRGDFNNYSLYNFEGYESDGTTPTYTFRESNIEGLDRFDINRFLSRWRAQVGIRYIFN